eukprot:g13913.t1
MEESKGGEPSRPVQADVTPTVTSMAVDAPGDEDIPDFSLCAALVAHTGDVRSLAAGTGYLYSGARDKVVMAWPLDEGGHIEGTHDAPAAQITLSDWVNALAVAVSAGGDEAVAAGCGDGGIYVLTWSGGRADSAGNIAGGELVVKTTLLGHTAPISSLSWDDAEGLLLSGSWDETAKAWDLETSACKWTLGGHENNVCVLGLGPGSVATGSTGLSVEGHLVGQQIRMWEGSPPKECRSLTDHTAGIRDLCLVDVDASASSSSSSSSPSPVPSSSSSGPTHLFCSGSNDATVRAWTHEGDCRAVFTIPDDSFVFSVSHLGCGLVTAGDDAGNLCAARVPSACGGGSTTKKPAKVVYKHPKTVWSVAGLRPPAAVRRRGAPATVPNPACAVVADVATGSADYTVRVFTPDGDRALKGDRLQEAEEALGEAADVCALSPGGRAGGAGGGFGDKLPSVAEMGVMVGARDGQLTAFADEATGAAQVFRWTEAPGGGEGKWDNLGPLEPPTRKMKFEGCLYDKVIPVEVESASRGFLMFQLGVNRGDDPKGVADAFCRKHSLGPEYLPQIEQFLLMAWL